MESLIPPRLRDAHANSLWKFHQSCEVSRPMTSRGGVIKGLRADGSLVSLSISVAKVQDKSQTFFVAVIRDATASVQQQEELRRLANNDHLTGLLNRRAFIDRVAEVDAQGGTGGTLAIFDIDHFKRINDHYGHPIGDQVLAAFARRLDERVGQEALTARWGGEEFISFHRDATEWTVTRAIKEFSAELQFAPIEAGEVTIQVSISAGITYRPPQEPLAAALERVDKLLYLAKHDGRGRLVMSDQVVMRLGKNGP
ncbi:GGDEF domain-containing protein [Allorhizobium sp. NPDC080224]|uniref:GGDEF domain-containing protein n=1 Tax=Allorhizobium sp. NPDC080224 TaxID=3390547 RepID=UPI003D00703F